MRPSPTPENLVIRPSGIWNSRAPLNEYIQQDRAIKKSVAAIIVALYMLREKLEGEEDKSHSASQILKEIIQKKQNASEAWSMYRRAHGIKDGKAVQPTVSNLWQDSYTAFADVQEMAVIRLSATFEAFAQCWTLNYILAKLESGSRLSTDEHQLRDGFVPFTKRHIPNWPDIVRGIPFLEERLSALPHLFKNPKTRAPVTEPLSPNLNALTAIRFWRSYRNQAVHLSRLVTRTFHAKYEAFFAEAMDCFGHIDHLVPGKPLPFHEDLYKAMAATHYRAALLMNEILETESSGRRGHPEAPNPRTISYWPNPPKSPPLLVSCDHTESHLWATNELFRAEVCGRNGWTLPMSKERLQVIS